MPGWVKRDPYPLAVFATAALLAVAAGRSASQDQYLPFDAGQVSSFAFNPVNPNVVYVGTVPGYNKGRVYQSTDGGGRWRLISRRNWTWLGALAADPKHSRTLYAGTGNAVYKSTNGGRTWRAFHRGLLPPPGVNRGEGWVDWLAVDPTNSSVLYEHDYAQTIRKSVDGGKSWRPVVSRWERGGITGLLLAPSRPPALYGAFKIKGPRGGKPGVYASTDGGKSWRYTRLWPSNAGKAAGFAFAADQRGKTIYAAVEGYVYSSTNGGRRWRFIGRGGLPQGRVVVDLAAGAGTLYAALGKTGIYETRDGGRTWTQSWPDSGPAPGLGAGIVAVDPARPTTVYASAYYPADRNTGTHILRSTDRGHTWKVVG